MENKPSAVSLECTCSNWCSAQPWKSSRLSYSRTRTFIWNWTTASCNSTNSQKAYQIYNLL